MKYSWSMRRFWKPWIKQDIKRIYYKIRFGWNVDMNNGTLLPNTGKGKYVSVYVKGEIIQIVDEEGQWDEIRIIPYQPNHGVMVERLKNGKVCERNNLDIHQLNKHLIFAANVEQLAGKEPVKMNE